MRQINEMRVDVESLQERMQKLEHEIKRNIVSEETFNRYKALLDDIYSRLNRENEEFEELRQFSKDTKDRIQAEAARSKDQRPYELILKIGNELESVHGEHTVLFRQSMDLKAHALSAARESLYYTGLHSFSFEQDIASLIFSVPLPLESMKGIIAPLLNVEQSKQWSLLTVWAEQNIQEEQDSSDRDNSFMEAQTEEQSEMFIEERKRAFSYYMELLIGLMEEENRVDLSRLIEHVKELGQEKLLAKRSFYDFWLLLHQRSPLQSVNQHAEDMDKSQWLESVISQLGQRTLYVREAKSLFKVNERFTIQNMWMSWEEDGYGD